MCGKGTINSFHVYCKRRDCDKRVSFVLFHRDDHFSAIRMNRNLNANKAKIFFKRVPKDTSKNNGKNQCKKRPQMAVVDHTHSIIKFKIEFIRCDLSIEPKWFSVGKSVHFPHELTIKIWAHTSTYSKSKQKMGNRIKCNYQMNISFRYTLIIFINQSLIGLWCAAKICIQAYENVSQTS